MVVSIDFVGTQRTVTRTRGIDMPIDGATRVTDALAFVKGRYPDLALHENHLVATVNSEMTDLDHVLKANDTVAFLPPIAGG